MSDFKPSRAEISIVGNVGQVQQKFDGAQTEVSIAVTKGYKDKTTDQWVDKGTDWYTFITRGDWQSSVAGIESGDRVEVTGAKLEQRLYLKNDGQPGVANELNYGEITVLERKADRQPVGASSGPSGF